TAEIVATGGDGLAAECVDLIWRDLKISGIDVAAEEVHFVGEVVVEAEGNVVLLDGRCCRGAEASCVVAVGSGHGAVVSGGIQTVERPQRGTDSDTSRIAQET